MEFKSELHSDTLSLSVPHVLMLKLLMLHLRNCNKPVRLVTMGKAGIGGLFCSWKREKKGLSPPFLCPRFVRSQFILVHFQSWFIEHLL